MKIDKWNVQQENSYFEGDILSKITLLTYDEFDTRDFIEYIKAYNPCKMEQTVNKEEE